MDIKTKVFLNGTVMFLAAVPFLFSQDDSFIMNGFTSLTPVYNIRNDSLISDTGLTVNKEKTLKKFRMKKSPTVAVLLSAVIPGAGQFYNESYWKIPIIGGLVGYFGYEYIRNNNLYKDYRELYVESQTPSNPNGDLNAKTLREFYRDQRDDFVWYFLITYTINLIDAYVDAHLFDFDVREEKLVKYGSPVRNYKLKINLKF
jgi:hypothetical protein